jgi:hypothetical protein
MFIIVPHFLIKPFLWFLWFCCRLALVGVSFIAGTVLGWTAYFLFTYPSVLNLSDLAITFVSAVIWFLLIYCFGHPLFNPKPARGFGSQLGFFRWFFLLSVLAALPIGLGRGVVEARDPEHADHLMGERRPVGPALQHVQSIDYKNSAQSSAVIGGRSVMVGEEIGEWAVKAIGPKNVILQNRDRKINLVLP